ncbi:MAG: type II secretion system protein [Deltaproteobacteria bacterium]|nr:type II secretion system protein [Deltaproteobacteria bacterium]
MKKQGKHIINVRKSINKTSGFTLIELLIVIGSWQ